MFDFLVFLFRWTPVKIKTEPEDLPPDPKRRKINREKWRLMSPPEPEEIIVVDDDIDTHALRTTIAADTPDIGTAGSSKSNEGGEENLEEQCKKLHEELELLSSDEDSKRLSPEEEFLRQQEREWEEMEEKRRKLKERKKEKETSTSEHVPDSVTSEHVPDSVTSKQVPDSVSSEHVPDSVTGEHVPDSVTNEQVPDSVTNERVPDSVTNEQVPDSVASEHVPDSVWSQSGAETSINPCQVSSIKEAAGMPTDDTSNTNLLNNESYPGLLLSNDKGTVYA